MSAKGKFSNLMSTRNLLILALIFSIIIAGYVLITTYSGESEEVLTVKEVLEKKDELTDSSREIKVKGYFIGRGDGENISIADSQKLPNIPESPDILTARKLRAVCRVCSVCYQHLVPY